MIHYSPPPPPPPPRSVVPCGTVVATASSLSISFQWSLSNATVVRGCIVLPVVLVIWSIQRISERPKLPLINRN